jgi:hypothetical protein
MCQMTGSTRDAMAHLAADRDGDAVNLAVDPDAARLCVVVTFVDMVATGPDPGRRFDRPQV